jgi:sugar O-acyltransferase (sialic acid O-acetyltransferase NeuD family)
MSVNDPARVLIPLINPNEPEALLAGVHVSEGQLVEPGDLLCSLETTKSTAEVEAEAGGYVVGLSGEVGDTVTAGDILCYLADDPDWGPPEPIITAEQPGAEPSGRAAGDMEIPAGMRITQPALALARQMKLDLSALPLDQLITERKVRAFADTIEQQPGSSAADGPFDPTTIVIFGGGGHGKALIDLLRVLGTYRIVGIVDDGMDPGETLLGLPILGGSEQLAILYEQGVRQAINAVGGIGSVAVRINVFKRLSEAGFVCPAVVHPTAFIEASAELSAGVQVFPQAYVGTQARLGFGSIVNSGAIVSHDCQLGETANISPGALLAGEVQIGDGALVGMGATINLRVKVGAGARIGNGATVKADVPAKGIVRAGGVWPEP